MLGYLKVNQIVASAVDEVIGGHHVDVVSIERFAKVYYFELACICDLENSHIKRLIQLSAAQKNLFNVIICHITTAIGRILLESGGQIYLILCQGVLWHIDIVPIEGPIFCRRGCVSLSYVRFVRNGSNYVQSTIVHNINGDV